MGKLNNIALGTARFAVDKGIDIVIAVFLAKTHLT